MEYFVEQGSTYSEVLQKIQQKYGSSAMILSQKNIKRGGIFGLFARDGVEISGYISQLERLGGSNRMSQERKRIINAAYRTTGIRAPETQDSVAEAESPAITPSTVGTPNGNKEEGSVPHEFSDVITEIRAMNKTLSRLSPTTESAEHESVRRLRSLLEDNDFSGEYIREIVARIRRELTVEALEDYVALQQKVLEWIGESIAIYDEDNTKELQRMLVLVGPTGVGKTTTIAKLAAMHGLDRYGREAMKVRIITIDNYRIGAKGQLETYGGIMNIPVAPVEDENDLRKRLALFSDAEMILIDTTGRSPRDYTNLAKMRELLDSCSSSTEYYLSLSATTKTSDIKEILQQFQIFDYQGIILTKLDETHRIGNIISVLSKHDKPLVYITDGQGVPMDIHRATRMRLLINLEGFTVDRNWLESAI